MFLRVFKKFIVDEGTASGKGIKKTGHDDDSVHSTAVRMSTVSL